MSRWKRLFLLVMGFVVIAGIATAVASSRTPWHQDGGYVAEGPGFNITKERFLLYKQNHEIQIDLLQTKRMSDNEIIDELIKKELTILDAKKRGVTVSDDEIDEMIQFQRASLNDGRGDSYELIKELMLNRIRITGMSDDEFWSSELVWNEYRDSIYVGKLSTLLMSEGEVAGMVGFDDYQEKLLEANKGKVKIRLDM